MSFPPRVNSILLELLKHDNLSVKELAALVGVSKRTMQRELNNINYELEDFALSFKTKPGKGVWLEGTEEAKLALLREIEGDTTIDNSSAQARQKKILLELLKTQDVQKIITFARMIDVSEATIRLDLKEIEKWLRSFELALEKTPGLGVRLLGSEANVRRAIRAYFTNFATHNKSGQRFDEIKEFMVNNHQEITELLDEDILDRVIDCLEDIDSNQISELTESSYIGLVIHLAIVVKRIQDGETITYNKELISSSDDDNEAKLARIIAEFLEAEFDIELDEMEQYYIALHLKGTKHQMMDAKNLNIDNVSIRNLINEMIDAYDEKLAFRLKQDDIFINGLLAHLQPTLIRLNNDMVISNPLLEQVKSKYPMEFEKCQKVANVLEKWTGRVVPVGEVGFLTIHFGSAGIRMNVQDKIRRKVNVGVICATGIGLSRLMAVSLEKKYGEKINVYSYSKNDAFNDDRIDFYLSSIKIEHPGNNLIYVNAIISDEDEKNIETAIEEYAYQPEKNNDRKIGVLDKLEKIHYYSHIINELLTNLAVFKVSGNSSFESIVRVIDEGLGEAGDSGIYDDLMRREKIGSQIFNELGFGLLHSKTAGVDKPLIAIIIPDKGESFSDKYLENVGVIVCLLMPINDRVSENSEILGYFSSILIEDDELLGILGRGESDQITDYLAKHFELFLSNVIRS